ncbi:MAG: alpha/beta hydrolase family protein [Methylacidiphilales bacterium]|nr:alpha/beta hydrolase family protein [Candidatus Methylacidiphilales bacterium]MDW8348859.1 alpha/beta hydrolase family protein [Verrucomicrobiae bacterium]
MPKAWRPMWAMRGQRRLIQVSPLATGYVENDTAHYDLYPCKAGWKAPTMLIAHGLMSVSDWGYRRWASRLNELGWNAVFVHLPYHYARRPRGKWSGELAITADLIRNVEGLRQCVIELRSLCDWLERQGCTEIGGWGTSYGGWILSVLGAVERRLKRVILVEPMINVESGIWSSPASRVIQRKLRQVGIKLSDAEPHFRLCCPRYMSLHCEPRDVLLVAGEYDEVTPAYEIEQLHRMWKGSHYACFPQGHVGYTLMPESFRLALNLWPEIWRK